MKGFLTVLLVLAMIAVVAVLLAGVVGMLRGGDPRRSNRLMRMRVVMQAAALAIFALLLLLWKHA
ncbi:MAG: twin transmembrane helix small protein [Alphaproteobacteria bacterium]|nr:twin transmembrane helix small protein [Alphaproteobacteria bacterium]